MNVETKQVCEIYLFGDPEPIFVSWSVERVLDTIDATEKMAEEHGADIRDAFVAPGESGSLVRPRAIAAIQPFSIDEDED